MNEVGTLVVLGLAAQRLLVLWLQPGEYAVFRSIRERLGRLHPKLQYAVNCPLCLSIWFAAMTGVSWIYAPALVWLLAISGSAGLIDSLLGKLNR